MTDECATEAAVLDVAELGDEIIGVAAIIRASDFGRPAVAQKGAALDQQAGMAWIDAEHARMLAAKRHGPEPLQRAHRPIADSFERAVERILDRLDRGEAITGDGREFERH